MKCYIALHKFDDVTAVTYALYLTDKCAFVKHVYVRTLSNVVIAFSPLLCRDSFKNIRDHFCFLIKRRTCFHLFNSKKSIVIYLVCDNIMQHGSSLKIVTADSYKNRISNPMGSSTLSFIFIIIKCYRAQTATYFFHRRRLPV